MFRMLAALLVVLCAACTTVPGGADADRDQVVAAALAWQAAYDSRDVQRIVAQYDPQALFWGTTAKTLAATPAAVTEYFKDAATRPNARVVLGEPQVRVYGDTAVASGTNTFTDVRDGQVVARPARYTFVFHRTGGAWRIVAHHSSAMP